jgi:hypothetical protein
MPTHRFTLHRHRLLEDEEEGGEEGGEGARGEYLGSEWCERNGGGKSNRGRGLVCGICYGQRSCSASALKLIVYAAVSYQCMRPYGTSVRGLKLIVYEALSY